MDRPTPRYRSADHHIIAATAWRPEEPATKVAPQILMSRGTSASYLVATGDGDVVINTGTTYQGARHRERFEALLGRPLDVRKIIITQSHLDHVGGWGSFAVPGSETIVQERFAQLWQERETLSPFFQPRKARVIPGIMIAKKGPADPPPSMWDGRSHERADVTSFGSQHSFMLGDERFDLYAAPSGESLDSVLAWMPRRRALFIGNFMGAIEGAMPNFYTLRGDRARSVVEFLRDIQFAIDLEPALLLKGHDAPVEGADRIRDHLVKIWDAVRHVHDATVAGMNAGSDLDQLMREITLPAELETAPGRGPLSWYVRAVWDEYCGWFQQRTTTELYAAPQRAIWPELVSLAGGAEAMIERAGRHLAEGRPLEAMHFLDMVLVAHPQDKRAHELHRAVLIDLIDRSQGHAFDLVGWLETELARTDEILVRLEGAGN
jgi:alkyl sulfatase BDS1-like metallo-beta-lactamase superfamily hydrolase